MLGALKKMVWFVLNKIFFNYQKPRYFFSLYMHARRYVLFYQGDDNRDRETNGGWRFLRGFARMNPKIVFDVGVHHGPYTLKLHELCPSTVIHAFEPACATYKSFATRVQAIKNIIVVPQACGSAEGVFTLYTNPQTDSINSFYKMDNQQFKHIDSEQVTCTTIDLYCEKNGIAHIDMLKIDVEGHDLDVIKGAQKMITGQNINIVQFEFGIFNTYSHTYIYDFCEFFKPYGYDIYKIKQRGLEPVLFPEQERTIYAYFVAVKKGFDVKDLCAVFE